MWSPRKIANPDYFEDLHPFRMESFSAVGLELWSMTSDIYFDNFMITSEKEVADRWAADSWGLKKLVASANEVCLCLSPTFCSGRYCSLGFSLVDILRLFLSILAWSVESVGTGCGREALAVGGLHPYRWFAYWIGCALLLAKGTS